MANVEIQRSPDATAFLARAGAFLTAREAENNLILGISSSLAAGQIFGKDPPYFSHVEDGDQVVAAAVQTPPWGLVLSLVDDLSSVDVIARDLHSDDRSLPSVVAPAEVARHFARAWSDLTGRQAHLAMNECIHRCEEVVTPTKVPGSMREATIADMGLLLDWTMSFQEEAVPNDPPPDRAGLEQFLVAALSDADEGLYLWIDDDPVSFAGYGGPTPHGIRIRPVYTPPDHRRRGYATALVAELTRQLLDGDRTYCFLFTDLSNPTSNNIYRSVGYEPVITVDQYRFVDPS
jgi:uncharacterized protein